jgi:hypothetical protein
MANHKVPTDVETADKLIGFLSLKQFIFTLAGFGTIFMAYTFAKATPFLAIPFLPVIFVFFILGLYQKKDQPVEVFLAAWLKFKLSPKTKIWNQEGYEQHVIVTAPKNETIDYSKGMTRQDVRDKLKGLGTIADTKGWSAKGVSSQDALSLGDQKSERLLSLEEVDALQKAREGTPEPWELVDVQDANNSTTASRFETGLDELSIQSDYQAQQIMKPQTEFSTATPFQQPSTLNPDAAQLNPQQQEQIQQLSTADAPISTVAHQAQELVHPNGEIDLDSGAVFNLH